MNEQERAAMQQALEALEAGPDVDPIFAGETEDALRAALAQQPEPAQEPVYWEVRCTAHPKWMRVDEQQFDEYVANGWEGQRLYTTPPQRPPLTDAEMLDIIDDAFEGSSLLDVARAIERKVRGE